MRAFNPNNIPRLPLEGEIDLTYRCNNNCRHCWLRLPGKSPECKNELSFDEIREIVDDARSLGCRRWSISGGEPMFRPDFAEIFDYLTRKAVSYTLNTNGTLISLSIARLLKRKGTKLIALYGATAEVHDKVTRNPGSFEAALRGIAHLKEVGAGFTVQLIPMRANYGQWPKMIRLAKSLSSQYRVGAPWLYLSACGSVARNREIIRQRLAPSTVNIFDPPNPLGEDGAEDHRTGNIDRLKDERLFANCIAVRREFHIDPYGGMTFCCFIKDPALRYNLRRGTFKEAWEKFIPSLADKVRGGREYAENCGACEIRNDCRWCPAYSYLEHGRYSAKIEYLCKVARETRRFMETRRKHHRCFYQIAGITIQVDTDLPITGRTFAPKFRNFQTKGPGADTIVIQHHFSLPDLAGHDLGREIYRKPPWAIYQRGRSWVYTGIQADEPRLHRVAVFNHDHTRGQIYHSSEEIFHQKKIYSLTLFPSDQILFARVLADRQACYLHAAGMILDGKGLLFAGHSEAGKSTMVTKLQAEGEILGDDRMIVRRWPEGFRIHGTWSNGLVPIVSAASAPLGAIMFLEKSNATSLIRISEPKEIVRRLLFLVIRPLVTADWCDKILALVAKIAREVPAYRLQSDKSGKVVEVLKRFLQEGPEAPERKISS